MINKGEVYMKFVKGFLCCLAVFVLVAGVFVVNPIRPIVSVNAGTLGVSDIDVGDYIVGFGNRKWRIVSLNYNGDILIRTDSLEAQSRDCYMPFGPTHFWEDSYIRQWLRGDNDWMEGLLDGGIDHPRRNDYFLDDFATWELDLIVPQLFDGIDTAGTTSAVSLAGDNIGGTTDMFFIMSRPQHALIPATLHYGMAGGGYRYPSDDFSVASVNWRAARYRLPNGDASHITGGYNPAVIDGGMLPFAGSNTFGHRLRGPHVNGGQNVTRAVDPRQTAGNAHTQGLHHMLPLPFTVATVLDSDVLFNQIRNSSPQRNEQHGFRVLSLGGADLQFDGNGFETGNVPSAMPSNNNDVTLSNDVLTRNGFTHSGWNTQANGMGQRFNLGQNITLFDDLMPNEFEQFVLFAEWSYQVTFNGNGNTSGNAPTAITLRGENTTALPNTTIERDHFTFGGWNTESDGSGITFTVGHNFSNYIDGNITLYAVWNALPPVTVVLTVAGTTTTELVLLNDLEDFVLTTPTLPAGAASFAGWFTNANGTGTAITELDDTMVNNNTILLFAVFVMEDQTMTLVFINNGTEVGREEDVEDIEDITKPTLAGNATRNFVGWSVTSTELVDGEWVFTFEPIWETITQQNDRDGIPLLYVAIGGGVLLLLALAGWILFFVKKPKIRS